MGIFITFEGIEGCGKTTQLKKAECLLRGRSIPILKTEEPGGTPLGRAIRRILLNQSGHPPGAEAELLLFCAARAQHVAAVIRPAMKAGMVVLCDRFSDATVAYQGYGRGIPLETVRKINHFSDGGLTPDLTILLDVTVETGLARALGRIEATRSDLSREDRFEHEERGFHERVRAGYLAEARRNAERCRVIDGERDMEAVFADVRSALEKVLREAGHFL